MDRAEGLKRTLEYFRDKVQVPDRQEA
ncbi:hypothetical protein CLV24_1101 [Pontibacter ummariensis]|uniref:Uncharacterized protein n=1 Tax=Pontibacter ummariensis TaxID=1610492 RepID=A0A239GCT8_9BACT|nr:hypothetical protein CLV24_1371 [Pontibacter ummariensis]PRY11556.1 hypothetical protein CLV24_1101 [Pontibacter ummariensis]SNS66283.1 hypothetical protein SAMN06296052_110147 [Pontibacter ummariensis]SNT26257.1 hypothetical protein SAMN06296052_1371 [Pontibacter ummariensis]